LRRQGLRVAVEVLERGDIQFFYRPRVQPADLARNERPGVQSFFVVLSVAGSKVHRRVRIGKQRMPAPTGERLWGRVERVGSLARVLADQIEDEQYTTKTRGERFQPGARRIAHGCYAFVRHDEHVHLAYRVEHVEDAELPDELRVPDAASIVVLFENPSPGRALWSTRGAPSQLDQEGEELVLVGVDDEPERALGIEVLPPAAITSP
jgi:hypothetical protein